MTEVAVVVVCRAYRFAAVAGDTERSRGDGKRMVMAMGRGKEVSAMADNTRRVRGDIDNKRSVGWILKLRRGGVAVPALAGVYGHWVVGRMTADTEWGVKDMA